MTKTHHPIKKKMGEIIGKRIEHLEKERKKLPYKPMGMRRIHPAWKQVNGRILELKRLRDNIYRMSIKELLE